MSPALGEPAVLNHEDAMRRIYSISLYAVDNLSLAGSVSPEKKQVFLDEVMDCLDMMQRTAQLATPNIKNLGE